MKFKIESTKYDCDLCKAEDFKEKYGNKLAPYNLEIISKENGFVAYVTIPTLQSLVELQNALDNEIIIKKDFFTGEMTLEIYDFYRE